MTTMTTNITTLEAETMAAILQSEFHDEPIQSRFGPMTGIYTWSVTEGRKDRLAALATLAAKGLVCRCECCPQNQEAESIYWLTEEGHRIAMAALTTHSEPDEPCPTCGAFPSFVLHDDRPEPACSCLNID
jgi:rubrerythrin